MSVRGYRDSSLQAIEDEPARISAARREIVGSVWGTESVITASFGPIRMLGLGRNLLEMLVQEAQAPLMMR